MHTRCWEDTKGQDTSSAHVRVAGKCAEAVRGRGGRARSGVGVSGSAVRRRSQEMVHVPDGERGGGVCEFLARVPATRRAGGRSVCAHLGDNPCSARSRCPGCFF